MTDETLKQRDEMLIMSALVGRERFRPACAKRHAARSVEVNPEGFLSLADLHKTLPEACEWDRGEADAALEACGITYRRKGNVHGFDGVRLREADDVQ